MEIFQRVPAVNTATIRLPILTRDENASCRRRAWVRILHFAHCTVLLQKDTYDAFNDAVTTTLASFEIVDILSIPNQTNIKYKEINRNIRVAATVFCRFDKYL